VLPQNLPSSKRAGGAPAPAARIVAWSFSRWRDYRKCPAYAKFKHVERLKEPEGPALARGSHIHELAQVFAQKSRRSRCPPELATFEAEFRVLQANRATLAVEQQWCFNREWRRTGWFDDDAWLRVVVDASWTGDRPQGPGAAPLRRLTVIDHKTGKVYGEHDEQLDLYALAGFLQDDAVDEVEVQFWYLDQGVQKPDQARVFSRGDVPALKKKWASATRAMLADTVFRPRPSKSCTWCAFSKGKGGPCRY